MKKIIKNITKTLSLCLVAIFATLPFAGCSNKNASKSTENLVVENIADNNTSTNDAADNVNTEQTTPEATTPEQKDEEVKLCGIYKLTAPIDYKDVWYEDEKATIEYFQTRDVNGIYNALRTLGFEEFVANVSVVDDKEYQNLYRFTENEIFTTVEIDGYYYDLSSTDYNKYLKIDVDENGNPTLYLQFTYENENGEIVKTPAYVKFALTLVENSKNIFSGYNYRYKEGSALINYSNTAEINETAIEKLYKMFDIEMPEDMGDKLIEITDTLEAFRVNLSKDLSVATVIYVYDDSYMFTPANGTVYSMFGIDFNYVGRIFNITTGIDELVFSITLDENTTFTFTYEAD